MAKFFLTRDIQKHTAYLYKIVFRVVQKSVLYVFWRIAYNRFIGYAVGNLQVIKCKKNIGLQYAKKMAATCIYMGKLMQCL